MPETEHDAAAYHEMLEGKTDPRRGLILSLAGEG